VSYVEVDIADWKSEALRIRDRRSMRERSVLIRRAFAIDNLQDLEFEDTLEWRNPPDPAVAAVESVIDDLGLGPVSFVSYGSGGLYQRIGAGGRSGLLANLAARDLGPHTDLPNLGLPSESDEMFAGRVPDITFLACIVGSLSVSTDLVALSSVLGDMAPTSRRLLSEAAFTVHAPAAWREQYCVAGVSCVLQYEAGSVCRMSPNLIEASTPHHAQAHQDFLKSAMKLQRSMFLAAGDILVTDNISTVHARSYRTSNETDDRTLIRAYASW
jgi:Taurine catabolism dioxygenase TauD, TfdA family